MSMITVKACFPLKEGSYEVVHIPGMLHLCDLGVQWGLLEGWVRLCPGYCTSCFSVVQSVAITICISELSSGMSCWEH